MPGTRCLAEQRLRLGMELTSQIGQGEEDAYGGASLSIRRRVGRAPCKVVARDDVHSCCDYETGEVFDAGCDGTEKKSIT